ncbi:putative uncharacterised conserved protein (DUF2315) [Lyophyllum shimeji]|uniref:Uncharacterized conserved protein (DUF2315) n=1 Tax=Lyophyllum shimeji TaxID=47721 RepID=A0A9P3PF88_LYOSH|nr:putative uncharacterised conserved protein (DUF2315) [Lyophyllum shimeji]
MFASLRPPPSAASAVRLIHASSRACNLVAPPDPVSHMRPIIYSDAPPPAPPSLIRHPYSLTEFSPESKSRGEENALQFMLQRQQLDDFHQHFWLDSNTRFEAAKQAVLAGLPSSAVVLDKEETLSEFYKQWYLQEAPRMDGYTREWRRRNIALIKLGARVEYEKLANRLSDFFAFRK